MVDDILFRKSMCTFISDRFHLIVLFDEILMNLRGVQPKFFVKLDFEIAVDQEGETYDQTFEGVANSQCRILCVGRPHPILAQKYQIRQTMSKPSKLVLYL